MNQCKRSERALQGEPSPAEEALSPQQFVASLSGRHALVYCAVGAAYPELGRAIVALDQAPLPDGDKQELLARGAWQAEAQAGGVLRDERGQVVLRRVFRRQGLKAFQRWVRLLWRADPEARGYRALVERAFAPILQLFRELREGWTDLTWSLLRRYVRSAGAILRGRPADGCKARPPPFSVRDPASFPYSPRSPPL